MTNNKKTSGDYSEKIKSPKWQKKRLEILNLKGFKCETCGNEEKQLHIHHRFYLKGRQPWEYDNDVFQVLCSDCHEKTHSEPKVTIKEVIPKKYEELILSIESINGFDIYNLIFLLQNIDKDDVSNTFRMLSNALNSGWLDRALDIIRDNEAIENLHIELSILENRVDEIKAKIQ